MTFRIHTKLAATIVVALAIVAVTASSAAAGKPSSAIHYSEPGSTGYVPKGTHVSIRRGLPTSASRARSARPRGSGAVATNGAAAGLDWESALIGGGVGLGIALVCAGALLAIRRRGTPAHA